MVIKLTKAKIEKNAMINQKTKLLCIPPVLILIKSDHIRCLFTEIYT